jgi:predicted DNA-binding antitoxin AbrB/MazE fold protein
MLMRIKAVYKDAVLRPLTKLDLREGEEIEIALKTTPIEKLEGLIKISNRKWVEEIIESPDLEPV